MNEGELLHRFGDLNLRIGDNVEGIKSNNNRLRDLEQRLDRLSDLTKSLERLVLTLSNMVARVHNLEEATGVSE